MLPLGGSRGARHYQHVEQDYENAQAREVNRSQVMSRDGTGHEEHRQGGGPDDKPCDSHENETHGVRSALADSADDCFAQLQPD